MKCARHPTVDTLLTCVTCGTPICPDCMVETPVGMKCRSCGLSPVPAVYRVGPGRLALAIAVGAALGAVVGALALATGRGFGLLALLLAAVAGNVTGDLISRATGGKRGPTLAATAAAAVAIGLVFLAPQAVALLMGGTMAPWSWVLRAALRQPVYLLSVILIVVTVFWKVR
jgi:hypothetical protein